MLFRYQGRNGWILTIIFAEIENFIRKYVEEDRKNTISEGPLKIPSIQSIISILLSHINLTESKTFAFPFNAQIIKESTDQILKYSEKSDPFYIIGHRLGNHKRYPINYNGDTPLVNYENTTTLMDNAFLTYKLTGLELDVRMGLNGIIYVTHDKIETSTYESEDFLKNNTLYKFLNHFIEKDYFKSNRLFIEIKFDQKFFSFENFSFFPDKLNEAEKDLIASCLKIIDELASKNMKYRETILNSISFISFSLESLYYIHSLTPNIHELFLIVTTNQFLKEYLSYLVSHVPLNHREKERIQNADWLTGLWFDPLHIDMPKKTFSEINSKRKKPLSLYLSTYGMEFNKIMDLLKEEESPNLPLSGVIYELE